MSYQVISRKYRPQRFSEVIGQSHICSTLQNAIKTNRISHAYLFTGSRGIGKTSTARILAKNLNCLQLKDHDPCNECQNCIEITAGRNMDVLEIDGASNRGIDQIRDLRENVKYPPSNSRYRIFIIDEVHMLTKEAFNALLKTLEEPPSHVIFIFATTEPLKIPATIISRCQRYDFHRIPIKEIVHHLKNIAKNEGVDVSDDILMLVAKKAEGGMRDAESLLDQLIAFSGESVSMEETRSILSLIDYEFYMKIGDEIFRNDSPALLEIAGKVIDDGINLTEFLSGFSEHFRNILIANTTKSVDMLDLPDNMKSRYLAESDRWDAADLLRLIKIITDAQVTLKTSLNHRMHIEFTLLRMGAMQKTVTVQDILESLKNPAYTIRNTVSTSSVKEELDLFNSKNAVESEPVVIQPEPKKEAAAEPYITRSSSEPVPAEPESDATEEDKSTISIAEIIKSWDSISDKIGESNPSLASFLHTGSPSSIKRNILTVKFKNGASFHLNSIKSKSDIVEKCIEAVIGKHIKIKCVEDKFDNSKNDQEDAFNSMTKKVMDIFGGEIIPM